MKRPKKYFKSFADYKRSTGGCSRCGGTGVLEYTYQDREESMVCPACKGSGTDPILRAKYDTWLEGYKEDVAMWKVYQAAIKKLTKKERKVLGL